MILSSYDSEEDLTVESNFIFFKLTKFNPHTAYISFQDQFNQLGEIGTRDE